jgi:hypothetical protein
MARKWACSSTVSTMDERPWKPRRRSVNPAAIQMRVPGLRSINAASSPALYAQALDQRRPPHSPVLGPVTQYGSKQTMLPTEWSVRLPAQQYSSVRGQQPRAEASFAIGSRPIRRCSCARIATGTPVGVDPVLSRNSGNRRAGNKCRLDDASLLRWGPMNPFRRATGGNLNRLAHKVIVDLIAPSVYTARSGRLHCWSTEPKRYPHGRGGSSSCVRPSCRKYTGCLRFGILSSPTCYRKLRLK